MNQLLETQPSRELKFTFEVKKQSTCNVQLINKTDQHLAFKVKTTSPKKYCVRPNVGVILPKGTHEFVVLMQAQRAPPADMICKDKFLIQSTIVPAGTMEEDVTSDMFSRGNGKYIEEIKLKVILLSPPPHSPELTSMNGKQKQDPPLESPVAEDELLIRPERHSPRHAGLEDSTQLEIVNKDVQKPMEDARLQAVENVKAELTKAADPVITRSVEFRPTEVLESNSGVKFEARPVNGMEPRMGKEAGGLRLAKDVEMMKSKLIELELKLTQAEKTISNLMEQRVSSIQERKLIHQDLALLRTQGAQKTIHEGFPVLFVCMVAMISLVIGYLLHT